MTAESRAVDWAKSLDVGLFAATRPLLGDGADVLPLVLVSAVGWTAVHILTLPVLRLLAPTFLEDVRKVARAKAKDEASAGKAEQAAFQDVAVRITSSCFSTVLIWSAIVLLINRPAEFLKDPDFGSTPYATFYCTLAAGYFVWDVVITVLHGYGGGFLFHAVGALAVEAISLHPFGQELTSFAHLFELSTPFMNARHLLISCGRTQCIAFKLCELGFAFCFFCSRIVFGWTVSFRFVQRVVTDLLLGGDSQVVKMKGLAFVPVALTAVVLCVGLGVLNAAWMTKIVRTGRGKTGPKDKVDVKKQ